METQEQVNNLINCLTSNDDLRQELWVYYLEGNPVESFSSHLKKIQIEYSDDKVVQENLWQLMQTTSNSFFDILNNFTDFEQSVVIFLVIGMNIEKISQYLGISQVRIKQVIASIRYNTIWRVYGIKEKSD